MVEGFEEISFNTSSSVIKIKQIVVPKKVNVMSNLVASLQGGRYWFKRRKIWF